VTIEADLSNLLEIEVGRLLQQRGLRLGLAESCTGGLIGHRITNIPGSSEYFMGGMISYSYESKASVLGVSWETLNTFGAVSRETVLEMARGACQVLNADISASVSGIAGPGGGTLDKPIGTTWVGLVAKDGEWAREFHFHGAREQNKSSAADAALQMLLDYLSGDIKK
jgi:PncC family amidohydrolase